MIAVFLSFGKPGKTLLKAFKECPAQKEIDLMKMGGRQLEWIRGLLWFSLLLVAPPAVRSQENVVVVNTTVGDAVLAAYPRNLGNGAGLLAAGDMDGDLDIDVIGSGWWSENVAGDGTVWTGHSVDTQITFINTAACADFDLNGTIDMVAGSDFFDEGLALMLNVDGTATNWIRQVVALSMAGNGHLASADIDGDGDPDIAGAFEGISASGGVMWWENPRVGTRTNWSSHLIEEGFEDGSAVLPGDIDGDADTDILVASANRDLVVAWLNASGDGRNWNRQVISSTVDAPGALALGDVNGDGRQDLLVAASGEDAITIWFQLDGSGTNYQRTVLADDIADPSAVQAVDLDGDLDVDVLAASGGGLLVWWENLDGSGANWTRRILSADRGNSTTVLAADMDGDGSLNIVQASATGAAWWENPYFESIAFAGETDTHLVANAPGVYVYLVASTVNTASGRWVAADWERTGSDPMAGSGAATGPFNLSGDTTITFNRQEQFYVDVSVSGSGAFAGPSGWLNRGSNIALQAVADGFNQFDRWEGDLPGGRSDSAAIQAEVNGPLSFTACFSPVYHLLTVNNPFGATLVGVPGGLGAVEQFAANDRIRSCATGDFDNDGDNDVAGLNDSGGLHAYLNQTGMGAAWQRETVSAANPAGTDLSAGDLNADGQDDVVVASSALVWWTRDQRTGSRWRSVLVSSNAATGPTQAACPVDLDGDGDLDLVAAGGSPATGYYIRRHGNLDGMGLIWSTADIATDAHGIPGGENGDLDGLEACDIDGDGDEDLLVIPGTGEGLFSYWENRDGAGGSWSNHPIGPAGYWYGSSKRFADLGDVDRDGDLDLLVSNDRYSGMALWVNREAESNVWAQTSIGLANTREYMPQSGIFLDVDRDGDLDVVVSLWYWSSSSYPSQLQACYNPGSGAGAWENVVMGSTEPYPPSAAVAAVNLDADGALDLLGWGDAGFVCWRRPLQVMTILSPPFGSAVVPASRALQVVPIPSCVGNSQTQWVAAGWARTGSAPGQGRGTVVPGFSFTNDAVLIWEWARQYKLDILVAEGAGDTDVGSRWVDEDASLAIRATAAPYYSFGRWQGDTNDTAMAGALLSLTMNHSFTLEALFLPDLTSQGVPHAWLARHGWTDHFEEAALLDVDDDSALAWMEYFADTDPTDEQSILRINEIAWTGATMQVDIQGGRDAFQVIEYAADLGPATTWTPIYTNVAPTAVSNAVEITPPAPGTGILRLRAYR